MYGAQGEERGDTVPPEVLSGHGKHGAEIHRLGETAPQEKHFM